MNKTLQHWQYVYPRVTWLDCSLVIWEAFLLFSVISFSELYCIKYATRSQMNHLWWEQFLKQALFSLIDTTPTWQCGLAKPSRLLKGWNQAFVSIQIKPNSLCGCNISEWFETNEQPGRLLKWLVCLIQQSKQYPEQTNKVYQAIIEHVCMALSPKLTLTYSTRSSAFMPSLSHQAIVA